MNDLRKIFAMMLTATMFATVVLLSACNNNSPDTVEERAEGVSFTQLEGPRTGDPIAIIRTSMGDITARLFPEYAPRTVENFVTHSRNGFYDGIIFHRVLEQFMIQTGDPTGTGMGGESIWGAPFEDEVGVGMHHIRGALSMANTNNAAHGIFNTNGSQFFIVQNSDINHQNPGFREELEYVMQIEGHWFRDNVPDPFIQHYIEHGGTLHLDYPGMGQGFRHSVFGQVIDGWDVLDAIAAVPVVNPQTGRPVEEVYIITIIISEYQ